MPLHKPDPLTTAYKMRNINIDLNERMRMKAVIGQLQINRAEQENGRRG
jgi:hypothetical protein